VLGGARLSTYSLKTTGRVCPSMLQRRYGWLLATMTQDMHGLDLLMCRCTEG
jgi:hypothetical protein